MYHFVSVESKKEFQLSPPECHSYNIKIAIWAILFGIKCFVSNDMC